MKLFHCAGCGAPLDFEAVVCESCERRLGFDPARLAMRALEPAGGGVWRALPAPGDAPAAPRERFRACANAVHDACNWLVSAEAPGGYCLACRHNRTVPDLSKAWNLRRWRRIEAAKRRLFYTLLSLGLPLPTRAEALNGLAFDFLADPSEVAALGPPVMTGHLDGIVTLNIAEADDVERARRRELFGEHYRTVLGHFRHEVAHYFEGVLVRDAAARAEFREVFGDERRDYGAALSAYYADGPSPDWHEAHVSAYASAHAWEDFAETFAHLLHILDTLETAGAFGLRMHPPHAPERVTAVDFDPHRAPGIEPLIEAWLPLTSAVNSMNRSMGQPDLYPFRLTPTVIGKLAFVHGCIVARGRESAARGGGAVGEVDPIADTLRAVIAGLRNPVAAPPDLL